MKLVFISNGLKNIYAKYIDLSKVESLIAHDGFSAQLRDRAKKGNVIKARSSSRLRVFYSGSVRFGRGIELLMGAARVLKEVDFHFAGDEEKYTVFDGYDAPNVHLEGRLSQLRIYEECILSDVLVALFDERVEISGGMSNIVSEYCSPLKLFEYMSCGKIIITVPYRVFFEFLNSNEALFINYNEQALIAVLRKVLCHREDYIEMENNCFTKAAFFSYENRAERISRLFS